MTLHEKIQDILSSRPNGASSREIAEAAALSPNAEHIAIVEAHLLVGQDFSRHGDQWFSAGDQKMQRVLTALSDYADASGKRVFRLSAALGKLPLAYQPTEDELGHKLADPGAPFKLLPNSMVKKAGSK